MPPNSEDPRDLIDENDVEESSSPEKLKKLVAPQADPNWKANIVHYQLVFFLAYFHIAGAFGLFNIFSLSWTALIFFLCYHIMAVVSVMMGAHRYWSHRSFKAKMPLQILMMLGFCSSSQYSIMWWAKNHRQHHMYSDTDADPHNPARGLIFAHVGWVFCKKHPDVIKRRHLVDVSDLENDPVVMFQARHHFKVTPLMAVGIPVMVLMYLGSPFTVAWNINMLRIVIGYHTIWLINSYAHAAGAKPYDKTLVANQNTPISLISMGEGFHNYHHCFPSDYRASELGNTKLNLTTLTIEAFAKIGWAYDLRSVAQRAIDARVARTGDGTDKWGLRWSLSDLSNIFSIRRRVFE